MKLRSPALVASFFLLLACGPVRGQGGFSTGDATQLDQSVEDAVVRKDLERLQHFYGDDLTYRHADGGVDTKASWLADVRKGGYVTRRVEGGTAELHGDVAITSGRLVVERTAGTGVDRYAVSFIRVYAKRGKAWQMISHRGLQLEELGSK